MKFAPKFASGSNTATLTIAQRPWVPGVVVMGGADTSWAGVPEAWVDREDRTLALRISCYESEWPALRAVLVYAQRNAAAITWWPDAAVPGTSYSVYLVTPAIGDVLQPERGDHAGTYEISITVRSVDGTAIEPAYY